MIRRGREAKLEIFGIAMKASPAPALLRGDMDWLQAVGSRPCGACALTINLP